MEKLIDKFWLFAEKHDAFLHMFLYGVIVIFTLYANVQWVKILFLLAFFVYALSEASLVDLQSKTIKKMGKLINQREQEKEF